MNVKLLFYFNTYVYIILLKKHGRGRIEYNRLDLVFASRKYTSSEFISIEIMYL